MQQEAGSSLTPGQTERRSKISIVVAVCLATVVTAAAVAYSSTQKTVTLQVDGHTSTFKTFARDVGQLLVENGVKLQDQDRVEPGVFTLLAEGTVVQVTRAFPVLIRADGQERQVATLPAAVRDAVSLAGVSLGPLDEVEPGQDVLLQPNLKIAIRRIRIEETDEIKEIPFQVEYRDDSSMEKGIRRIVQQGRNGEEKITKKVIYADGSEIERREVSRQLVRPPVKRVIAMGSLSSVSRGGQNIRFQEARVMLATAYSPEAGPLTATGDRVRVGIVAVDPKVIPLRTKLYVEGYGYATALDVGSAIKGDRIDVFLETETEAQRWGRKKVKVYILE